MYVTYMYSKTLTLRYLKPIILNQDVIKLIMLESTIHHNHLFFMTCQYCYKVSKDPHYWKSLFLKHHLPILSYHYHQTYPTHPYQWLQEYKLSYYALSKTNELLKVPFECNMKNYYQSAIIGYLRVNDDLSWLPIQFYKRIKKVQQLEREFEYHELHFLIYQHVGTVNYQSYDTDDNIITVLTANLKADESTNLIMSMLYHLPDILVKIL